LIRLGSRSRPTTSSVTRAGVYVGLALLMALAVYGGLSKVAGFSEVSDTLRRAEPQWLAVAAVLSFGTIATYVLLFHRVAVKPPTADHGATSPQVSCEIALAGLGAATLLSAGGAGGIALEAWALSRLGLARREIALRLTTFNVLLYAVYMLAVVVFGLWLWAGLPGGPAPPALTAVPAALAGTVIVLFLAAAAHPGEGRLWLLLGGGTTRAIELVRRPREGAVAAAAAVGYWAANVGALGACFAAYGETVPLAVLVHGFFVGMVANLVPLLPGGAGTVDAGLVGALVALGEPASVAIVAVLSYRLVVYWLPTIPELVAFARIGRLARADPASSVLSARDRRTTPDAEPRPVRDRLDMTRVLVAYASKHGSTAEIASAVAQELRGAGLAVELVPAAEVESVAPYDAVVIGSAVYRRRWRRDARRLLSRERTALSERPVWIFSSGDVGQSPDDDWVEPSGTLALAEELGVIDHAVFGGRLPLEPSNLVERLTVRNTPEEFRDRRDFGAIRAWAGRIADHLAGAPAT
jgi:menaquinone-dependent protoporphyrinogen IX oxidase/uncharacterized membrane protein YbhN (UPF0104 family)